MTPGKSYNIKNNSAYIKIQTPKTDGPPSPLGPLPEDKVISSMFIGVIETQTDGPPHPTPPPPSKLPELRVNFLLFNAVNESPFETVN